MVENKNMTDLGAKTVFRNMRLVSEFFRDLTDEDRDEILALVRELQKQS